MILNLTIVGLLLILSIINLILYKGKRNLVLIILGFIISLLYLAFYYVDFLKEYTVYYLIFVVLYLILFSLLFTPKKITKNLTEYDYFELESSYKTLENDREKLRERYLSTISLIDEGIIFYENSCKDVILSDRAHEIFKGEQSKDINEHVLTIYEADRNEYLKQIERASSKTPQYEMKYRVIINEDEYAWVMERGHYIGVNNKKSIIASVIPLNAIAFKKTSYFDIDSVLGEEKLFPKLKELKNDNKNFVFISLELTNIPELNKKYGRDTGSLMMSEYLRMIKREYTTNQSMLFRVTGIRYVLLIDEDNLYEKFHNDLINNYSELYNNKIRISAIKENVVANFSVIKLDKQDSTSADIYNLSMDLLDEAIQSKRKNFVIYNE